MKQQKQTNIAKIAFVLIVLVFAGFIFGEIYLSSDQPKMKSNCRTYHGNWERILPDGQSEPVKMPGKCQAKRNEVVTVQTVLPEKIKHGQYLCFRSAKQDMRFYVDGYASAICNYNGARSGKIGKILFAIVSIAKAC